MMTSWRIVLKVQSHYAKPTKAIQASLKYAIIFTSAMLISQDRQLRFLIVAKV